MDQLSRKDRMVLMKFVCSFAWTDLTVQPEEMELIIRLAEAEDFDRADREQIARWLDVPPEIDPDEVPRQHRELFLDAMQAVVEADGKVVPAERDAISFFRALLGFRD